jgi:hypothetical protein
MRVKYFFSILGIFFVTISLEVKGVTKEELRREAGPWFLENPITPVDVKAFNEFRDSDQCKCKERLKDFGQDMMIIEQQIATSRGEWNERVMSKLHHSALPLIVQAVLGFIPLTEEKAPKYLQEASKSLPILTKATRILAHYLYEKEKKDLSTGSFRILEQEGKEVWFTYAKTNCGYLPLCWNIWKDGGGKKYIFGGPVYWKNRGVLSLYHSSPAMTESFSFIFDISRRSLVEDRGIIVSLFPTKTTPGWKEHLTAVYGIRDLHPLEYLPEVLIVEGKAKELLGDQYPAPFPMALASKKELYDSIQEFFIPLPSSPEDYADVYDAVIQGLVEDYRVTTEEGERSNILQTLCALGEASLLLENTPVAAVSDVSLTAKDRRNQARQQKQKEFLTNAIEAAQEKLAAERVASAQVSVLEDISGSAVAGVPDVASTEVAAEESPLARELDLQRRIEAQNKEQRDARAAERAAKQAVWEASHSGKGGGGGTASAAGAGAGAGSGSASAASTAVSIDPADKRMKWKHVVNYIKNTLKQAGVAAKVVTGTGSSHFRLEAVDTETGATATDTLVYQHGPRASGGYGSWYQGIVERVLGNLGKTVVVEASSRRK